jgi:solute carrier family 13 (sodium-dependent dicarboxylate transporter), member 2/3/5
MVRWLFIIFALVFVLLSAPLFFESPTLAQTVIIAGICLVLWLSESVPPFVPTFLLWTITPLLLAPLNAKFALPNVLSWAVDPVLALFLGGFAVGVAAERHGLDKRLALLLLRAAGGSAHKLLLLIIFATAFLSMWMSNIAAAALMLACLHPVLKKMETNGLVRRTLLVGVALGANLGGISTPIGTGPNAIAIASLSGVQSISFLKWMFFALPLSVGMLIAGYLLLTVRLRLDKSISLINFAPDVLKNSESERTPFNYGETSFLLVLGATIVLWLTEPWHGVSSAVVALGATSLLFLSQILKNEDLLRIDWSTLLLIAGGITLGKLLEQSDLIKILAAQTPLNELNPMMTLFLLCLASATLSALMSNTATVVMLIPLAMTLIPEPSTAILVAIAASFGMPFVISTPPNAIVYGEGGIRFSDLFLPGIILMLAGCLIVSISGRLVLSLIGIN